jgi:hypothetical protein
MLVRLADHTHHHSIGLTLRRAKKQAFAIAAHAGAREQPFVHRSMATVTAVAAVTTDTAAAKSPTGHDRAAAPAGRGARARRRQE